MGARVWRVATPKVIRLLGNEVPFVLKQSSRRRTIGFKVDHSGLTVSAPLYMPLSRVDQALREQAGWVLDKLRVWQARRPPEFVWKDGASLLYFGERLALRIREAGARPAVVLERGVLNVSALSASPSDVERRVVAWYRRQALAHFLRRIAHFAPRLGVTVSRVLLSNAGSRWGSCNSRGEIRLNWRLIKAEPALIDYVVAHELAHLRHMNHSPAFWRTVAQIYPDYETARHALKEKDAHFRAF